MPYKKYQQGSDVVFEVTPELPPQIPKALTVPGVILAVVFAILLSLVLWLVVSELPSVVGTPIGLVLNALLLRAIWRRYNSKPRYEAANARNRNPSKFGVSPNGITIDGVVIQKTEIHRLRSRNMVLEDMGQTTVVAVVTHDSEAYRIGQEAGMRAMRAWKQELARVSYLVEVEASGVPRLLAGGLTEAAAFAVLSDVSGVLGLNSPPIS